VPGGHLVTSMGKGRGTNGNGRHITALRESATHSRRSLKSRPKDFLTELQSGLLRATGADRCAILLAPGWHRIVGKWLRLAERDFGKNGRQGPDQIPVSWIKVRHQGATTHIKVKLLLGGSVAAQITVTTGNAKRVRRILRVLAKAIPRMSSRLCLEWLRREASLLERRRLSEDLHDGPLQIATAAKIWLQVRRKTAQAPEAAAGLDEAIVMMGRVVASMRDLMRSRVQGARAHSLKTHLRRAARRWTQITGVRVMFSFPDEGLEDKVLLSQDSVKAVEHLVGEGIVNAWKHGKATQLWVSCRSKDGGLALTLKDDGHGFQQQDEVETPDGMKMGLRLLQSRITELGGRLDVSSPESGGTVIETWLPQRLAVS